MPETQRPILILKTGCTIPAIASRLGDFEDWIAAGLEQPDNPPVTVDVFRNEPLPPISGLGGVIITGSPAMVTEREDWILASERFVLDVMAAGLPMLGICFGHQLLGQALGGNVGWHPGGREIGTVDITLSEAASSDRLFAGINGIIPAHVTHMQSVLEPPADAVILAGNAFEPHQGLRFTDNTWGIQFHPEFDEEIMRGYLTERYDQVSEEGLDPDRLLAQVQPAPQAHSLLKRFSAICLETQTV